MNGPIAQLVALACHGNAFLQDQTVPQFFPTNSTCTFCDEIIFVEKPKLPYLGLRDEPVAKNPNDWFLRVKTQGARALCITRTPQNLPQIADRMSAGFVGGGGSWALEVLFPEQKSEAWMAQWEVWDQKAPERRIWRVIYRHVSTYQTAIIEVPDIGLAERELLKALCEIHMFAAKNNCGGFTECFANAIDSLNARQSHAYHKDLAPAGFLSEIATSVLDACQSAWVFGGMGSWNDMGFDGEITKEYDRVSEQLYTTLTKAICVATNTTAKLPPPSGEANPSQIPYNFR
jgi:hypothetical protein